MSKKEQIQRIQKMVSRVVQPSSQPIESVVPPQPAMPSRASFILTLTFDAVFPERPQVNLAPIGGGQVNVADLINVTRMAYEYFVKQVGAAEAKQAAQAEAARNSVLVATSAQEKNEVSI